MKKKLIKFFILLTVLSLTACNSQTFNLLETTETINNPPEIDNSVDVFDLFQKVLRNEKPFSFANGFGTFYLNEYLHWEMPQAREVAVFDLFDNGNPVVILNLGPYILKLILFQYEDEILAYELGIRSMNGISQYGTFRWSGGGGSSGVARVELVGNELNYIIIFGVDWLWQGERVEGHIYFLYDRLISYEEYSALFEIEFAKESINWYPFVEENINNLITLETLRVPLEG